MDNILNVLGVQGKEDVISNLICYCLINSESFQNIFLEKVCQIDPQDFSFITARTRIAVSLGVPDLIITCTNEKGNHLFIIENKLKAEEGKDQLNRYASCQEELKEELKAKFSTLVFLTLFPDQEPDVTDKTSIVQSTYNDLLEGLKNYKPSDNIVVTQLLTALKDNLAVFYDKNKVNDTDDLLSKLKNNNELDGNYLYFKAYIKTLEDRKIIPDSLKIVCTFRSSARGRKYYGAQITKDSWHPEEMKEKETLYEMTANCFNIHIELQFDVLKNKLNIYFHYEVNEYHPEKWVKQKVEANGFKAYSSKRAEFIAKFENDMPADITIGGRSNQFAKATISIKEGMTILEINNKLAKLIKDIETIIDKVLLSL